VSGTNYTHASSFTKAGPNIYSLDKIHSNVASLQGWAYTYYIIPCSGTQ